MSVFERRGKSWSSRERCTQCGETFRPLDAGKNRRVRMGTLLCPRCVVRAEREAQQQEKNKP